MGNWQDEDTVFAITVNDLQIAAIEKTGRKLSSDEIAIAKKGLQWGLLTDIDTVYHTIFTEMI